MNITNLKSELQGILHGTTLNKVNNINRVIDRAARQLLLEVDPQETMRMVQLDPVFLDVFNYPCPVDLKGNAILDIRPQVNRTMFDRYVQTYSQEFDLAKQYTLQANYNVQFNTGIKTLQIDSPLLLNGLVLNQADSTNGYGTWGGTVSNISVNTVNFAASNAALMFDVTATGQYIDVTMPTGLDMTNYQNISSQFWYNYFPDASVFSSVELQFGTDNSNYFTTGAIAITQEATTFEDGWNLLKGGWASTVGTPDITNVVYIKVIFNTDGTSQTGVMLNNIVARIGTILQVLYYSRYMFSDATTGAWQETVTADSNIINLATESYNILLNLVALYCIQQVFDGSSTKDIAFYQKAYDDSLKRYKALYKSQKNQPKVTYYKRNSAPYRGWFGRWNY